MVEKKSDNSAGKLASAGDSPEDTEAVESYLAKKRSASQRSSTAANMEKQATRRRGEHENRDLGCPRGFVQNSGRALYCSLVLFTHFFGFECQLDVSDNNEHVFLDSSFIFLPVPFLMNLFFQQPGGTNERRPWSLLLVRLRCSIERISEMTFWNASFPLLKNQAPPAKSCH